MENPIEQQRRKIDQIDQQIIKLIHDRQMMVQEIGRIKQEHGLPVYDPKRELASRTSRRKLAKELALDPLRLEVIFEQIVLLARETQTKQQIKLIEQPDRILRVGIMGGVGSFSEAAAQQFLADKQIINFELYYPISSENVLKDLEEGKIDLAILPIENSRGGLVTESIYAACKHQFEIQEIFNFNVIQCLLALPGVNKADITKIMSHEQALKQCQDYLQREFPAAELIEATDTAEGARMLEQSPDERTLAVIAPEICAQLYHLTVLEKGIQDLKQNYTRFIAAKTLT